eukprot:11600334-Alexandrium_andersonii.AAC.1
MCARVRACARPGVRVTKGMEIPTQDIPPRQSRTQWWVTPGSGAEANTEVPGIPLDLLQAKARWKGKGAPH